MIATYRYDALGRRVEKAVSGGATTRYILDGVQVVEEYDGSNSWQARYVYEDGIDHPRSMDRADISDVNGNSNTTEVLRFHYHQQALGCVTEMTQPTGAVVEWVTYDVYGQPTIRDMNGTVVSQSAVGNPYLYTGREYDPESGLYFYRARHYDPTVGGFAQRDPRGYVDGMRLYEYARSSPTDLTDPLGLDVAENQATTSGVRQERGQERVQHALGIIRDYGSAEARSNLEAVERARDADGNRLIPITFIPKGDERHKGAPGGFHTRFGIRIYERNSSMRCGRHNWWVIEPETIWDLVQTLLEELQHAASALGRSTYRMPTAGAERDEDESLAHIASSDSVVDLIQGRMGDDVDEDGRSALEREEEHVNRDAQRERAHRSYEYTTGRPRPAPVTTPR